MRARHALMVVLIFLPLIVSNPYGHADAGYSFRKIDSTARVTSCWWPWINNNGDVVYHRYRSGKMEIVISNGRLLERVVVDGVKYYSWGNAASMNDYGSVAFMGWKQMPSPLPDDKGIFIWQPNGSFTKAVDFEGTTDLKNFTTSSYPVINNVGTVAFRAEKNDRVVGIFRSTGNSLIEIATDEIRFNSFGIPVINDANYVVFGATLQTPYKSGIYAGLGGATTIVERNGEWSIISDSPRVNNSNIVSFTGSKAGNADYGVYRADNGTYTKIADNDDGFSYFESADINDSGHVAFTASLTSDYKSTGIWIGPRVEQDKVIKAGDPLDNSHMSSCGLYPGARFFNNIGQIVFWAELENGVQGIYRADPPGFAEAEFTANPRTGVKPLTVEFTSTSIGAVFDYEWDFGDGGVSTDANPTHTYTESGSYTVSLTVTGAAGDNTERKTGFIIVKKPALIPSVQLLLDDD
jgi:PKD repeat protein